MRDLMTENRYNFLILEGVEKLCTKDNPLTICARGRNIIAELDRKLGHARRKEWDGEEYAHLRLLDTFLTGSAHRFLP
jgi:hypothetical protein